MCVIGCSSALTLQFNRRSPTLLRHSWHFFVYLNFKSMTKTQRRLPSFIYIVVLLLPALLCGCGGKEKDDRPVLTVSIEPLRYVAEAIAGEKYRVQTIMPRGASPESYEPTPRQMVELAQSGIVLRTGTLGFEQTKLPALVQAGGDCRLIDLGADIEPISDGGHGHDGHESIDPHLWTAPDNLVSMASRTCQALCQADTANAAYYRSRLETFREEMEKLDARIRAELKEVKQRTFLIYHPALGYFARRYGLRQLAVEHDGKAPSAAHLQDLTNQCRAEGVRCVFISQEHNGQAARRVAAELRAQVVEINPLDYDIPAQLLLIVQSLKDEK